jgi:hypothetical protein
MDFFARAAQTAWKALRGALAPASNHGAVTGLLLDVTRSRRELIAEMCCFGSSSWLSRDR